MTVQPLSPNGPASSAWSLPSTSEICPVQTNAESLPTPEENAIYVRTQFLRRVAHDIASPTGVTMTVLEELAVDAKRPELVAMARRGLKRLLRLSEQLALAADLEAGGVVPVTTPEDIRSVVDEALQLALGIDGRRDIAATSSVPEGELKADVDRRLMLSVIREVIGNALRLASSKVHVDVEPSGDKVVIRVHDDGPGFREDVLATLGQRFSPRPAPRGLGLSLSIAKEVLASHSGDLHVETSALPPGRRGVPGACVVLTLPRR